jgi:hypothetical protein
LPEGKLGFFGGEDVCADVTLSKVMSPTTKKRHKYGQREDETTESGVILTIAGDGNREIDVRIMGRQR